MTDLELALTYAPKVYYDANETIPLRTVGYTVAHETVPSPSFANMMLEVPEGALCTIEYAYYWDYDIQHMYDLEHTWVTVGQDGGILSARGSFHGKYLNLYIPELPTAAAPEGTHVVAFCQPGKHAFLPDGQYFRLIPGWFESCTSHCGGRVLIGGPFSAARTPGGEPAYKPTEQDHLNSARWIRENLSFTPSMQFTKTFPEVLIPWPELYENIPRWINAECERLRKLYRD